MKILVATHYYPEHIGGIESIADNLTRRLKARGHEISWCALNSHPMEQSHVSRIPLHGYNFCETALGFPWPLITPRSLARIYRLARDFDLIHIHDALYMACAAATLSARIAGVPLLVTQHIDLVPYSNPLLRWSMQLANLTLGRLVLSSADQVIFYSRQAQNYFGRYVPFKRDPLFIPNGVDTDTFAAMDPAERARARLEFGFSAHVPLMLFVGRFTEKKGVGLLKNVCESVCDCNFAFAGRGPEDPGRWQLPNVKIFRDLSPNQLKRLYNAADLLLLPSVGEGFPVAVQEALSCGTPCLLSTETADNINLPPQIRLSCPRSTVEFVSAIRTFFCSSNQDASIRSTCATYAREHWNWEKAAGSYEEVMLRLIQERRR